MLLRKYGRAQVDRDALEKLEASFIWSEREARVRDRALMNARDGLSNIIDLGAFDRIVKEDGKVPLIVTIVTKNYIDVGLTWFKHIQALSLSNYVIVCGDEYSYDVLTSYGAKCLYADLYEEEDFVPIRGGFSAIGLLAICLKYASCLFVLERNRDVLFSDIDAFWLSNPMPYLEALDGDLMFQTILGLPRQVVNSWGFAACTGFFLLRASEKTRVFCRDLLEMQQRLPDDQVNMNLLLARDEVVWEYHEAETISVRHFGYRIIRALKVRGYGFHRPVYGASRRGLRLVGLPHDRFRRHLELDIPVTDAWILHPNTVMRQEDRLKAFEKLGVRISRVPPTG